MRLPRIGGTRDAWPGLVITGLVVVSAAVLADAVGDPPRGGPRLVVGLTLGLAVIGVGYLVRRWEQRRP